MKYIEELSFNAFPSIQTNFYDGWIIRFADGYSNRSNSVNPIYESTLDCEQKILHCEYLFKMENLSPTFKITPFVKPSKLDSILESKNYQIIRKTSVQTANLENIKKATLNNIKIYTDINEEWLNTYKFLTNPSIKNYNAHVKIFENITVPKIFVILYNNNDPVACGTGMMENGYIGIYDINVSVDYRNKGYGKQLLLNILNIAKSKNIKTSYLNVMLNNYPALKLYSKLNYKEIYTYHYRVKK
jgi:GNAT superfamily N-acetyltransferase